MRRLSVLLLVLALLLSAAGCGGKSDKRAAVTDEANAVDLIYYALPSIMTYYDEHNTFTGMTLPKLLRFYNAGLRGIVVVSVGKDAYCVEATFGETTAFSRRPGRGQVMIGSCSDPSDGRPTPAAWLLDSQDVIDTYKDDHEGWQGMTLQDLKTIAASWKGWWDGRIPNSLEIVSATKTGYCVQITSDSKTMHMDQSERVAAGSCP